ncbi:Secreted effector protein pipB2 [Gimesia alba]|uniref:Secreted effector protein pipB2 n=1 Tax=Gimesia alba TaxID=2527973 RepID=A0A517RL81_9PLAN|nr:pentapeptide repeat-containing protein [Gimesia alba]QDT44641.1 Secreted effector protein pipB2 [Gimesia alba]
MANPEHVKIVKQGAGAIEKWRSENPDVQLDLGGADLKLSEYHEAFLANADLTGVTLSDTDVSVDFLYGNDGVVRELKNKVDSHLVRNERSKKRVRIFFGFLNWSVTKLLGSDLVKAGSAFKNNVESWQSNRREQFPASEGIELAIAAFIRFVRVGFVSLLIALIPISFQIFQTFLMNNQNRLISDQNQYFRDQNDKIQKQLDDQSDEDKRANRNRLIAILYEEYDVTNYETKFAEPPLQNKLLTDSGYKTIGRSGIPKANLRSRQEAVIEFIRLELEAKRELDLSYALLQGLDLSRSRLQKAGLELSLCNANLSGAHLVDAKFVGTQLENTNLRKAIMYKARLDGAILVNADLTEADLSGAYLNYANFTKASLIGATLRYAVLGSSTYHLADLEGADLSGANMYDANLNGVIVSKVLNEEGKFYKGTLDLVEKPKLEIPIRYYTRSDLTQQGENWIESLSELQPPVEGFDFNSWMIEKTTDSLNQQIYVLRGSIEAKKPNLEN